MTRRAIGIILGSLLTFGFSTGGCVGNDSAAEYNNNPDHGGELDPNAAPALEFISSENQTLEFGQVTTLAVRYVDRNKNEGIAHAPIGFAIDGESYGSQLEALQTTTDTTGEARMSLTAGQQNGSFRVQVSPQKGGNPISFKITVSDQPLGSLAVAMTYLGDLPLENLKPQLYRGISCNGLDPNALPVPLKTVATPLNSIDATTDWEGLEVGADYAVTVTGQVGPNIRAFGCVDMVEVLQAVKTDLKVALADLYFPGPVLGTYDLVNRLDFGGELPGSAKMLVDLLDELTDDQDINCNLATEDYGQDPGAFLTDFVMRQTCRWECLPGESYDNCSQVNHGLGDIAALCLHDMMFWNGGQPAFFGGCGAWEIGAPWLQQQINSYVEQNIPGGILAFMNMAGDLARAINQAKIYSELNVQEGSDTSQPMSHRLVEMEVLLHDMYGVENIYRFELADVGLKSLKTNAALTVDGTLATIPKHSFELSYGKLLQYIYLNGLLPMFGYTSTTDMFASWVDCTEVGQWLATNVKWVPMSAQGWKNFCDMGIQLAGTTFDSQLASAINVDGVLELEGTCTVSDIDPISNIAATLSNGYWTGGWSEGASGSGITGSFVGTSRP